MGGIGFEPTTSCVSSRRSKPTELTAPSAIILASIECKKQEVCFKIIRRRPAPVNVRLADKVSYGKLATGRLDNLELLQGGERFFHLAGVSRAGDGFVPVQKSLEVHIGNAVIHIQHTETS
jgi:hypothetical protein